MQQMQDRRAAVPRITNTTNVSPADEAGHFCTFIYNTTNRRARTQDRAAIATLHKRLPAA